MLAIQTKTPHYESVPVAATSSFAFREFSWPQFPFNWHYHPELEITLIVKGHGLRFVGDSIEEFREGDLCLLGSNTPHCWASDPKARAGVCSLVIQFQPSHWGEAFWQTPEMHRLREFFDKARRGIVAEGHDQHAIGKAILAMRHMPAAHWQRTQTLLFILGKFADSASSRPLASSDFALPASKNSDKRLGQILGYIHAHLGPDLHQQDVARSARMSPQAFSLFFKRWIGKTYVAYVNELKIHKACRELLETDLPVTEITFQAGFNNLSHFNDQFRQLKQMTPRAYRQWARNATPSVVPTASDDWLGEFK